MAQEPVAEGLMAYRRRRWTDAYTALTAADARDLLTAGDLDRLGTAAHLIGRPDAAADAWQRAYGGFLGDGQDARAARCAFWLALTLLQRGEHARAGGWLARAHSVLDAAGLECAERGYLRLPVALQALSSGDASAAHAEFEQILEIAEEFDDADLRALGRLGCGQALVAGGEVERGVALLDEAMVAVTSGEISTIAAGLVYCSVIIACQEVFDLGRAQEWTGALSRWCASQQDLAPYRGQCSVHRSQIMQLRGEWADALEEAQWACRHLADPPGDPVLGMAYYQQAELLRVRGDLAGAEQNYRRASRSGHPVQPGLALLRLAQGRLEDATAAAHRLVEETVGTGERSRVLAACVEISLAVGDLERARTATDQLEPLAGRFDSSYLHAVVDSARGSVLLADGDPAAGAAVLGRALSGWQALAAPYEAAQVRLRRGQAYRQLGDHDTAEMELDAARRTFEQLGAAPALARARELLATAREGGPDGLTARELEVLRLVATGMTNRQIAEELVISQKTVARHVANVFAKLDVTSRAAATAYAYEHDIVHRT